MNLFGPAAFLETVKTKVTGLFTGPDVAAAAHSRGIALVPSTLGDCLDHDGQPSNKDFNEPLAISEAEAAALCSAAESSISRGNSEITAPHFVDTKAIPWI